MVAVHRSEWNGDVKMLLIAIDIGTTFTAASFSILEPGSVPMFQEVCENASHFRIRKPYGLVVGCEVAQAGEYSIRGAS
jgi:hypothetical protein